MASKNTDGERAEPTARALANLDLNLLVTLNAVLHHQSVTRAAEHLGVTQPAVSASLARLRRHFDDEILHRVGNRYQLTPFGIDLRQRTRMALTGVERVFASRATFEATDTTREYTVITSDYTTALLGQRLTQLLDQRAPHARLRWLPSIPDLVARAEHTLTAHDVMLVPHGFVTDLPNETIFHDDWIVVSDPEHTPDPPTADDLRRRPWVLVYNSQTASTPAARRLRMLGIEPRVQVVTESFLTAPALVTGSARIALLPRRMLDLPVIHEGLRADPCPVDLGQLTQAMWWHPMLTDEPEHRFLRTLIRQAALELNNADTAQPINQSPR
ncbi:LysR family transcriptional regulator [Nocardia sp. NPDC005366]|uniref:LysR family transcriptional regulator n=1 Tax=Nocardia sp. NPDC005366 TaxID=3156878 RepID=UPI0033A1F6FC